MPSLAELAASTALRPPIKLLYLGDSGSGKTGSTASLVIKLDLNLRFLDFDNGTTILRDPTILPVNLRHKVIVETCIDPMVSKGGRVFPKEARAWTKASKLLNDWPGLGPVTTWTSQDVLIVDSTTFAGKTAMNFHLSLNGRLAVPPTWKDFQPAQDMIANLLYLLYDESVKCNVIVIAHVDYTAPPGTTAEEKAKQEIFRGYPTSIGSALGPKMGRAFNDMLLVRDGYITPRSRDGITLKSSAPGLVKQVYPLATGLADYFLDVRGEGPKSKQLAATDGSAGNGEATTPSLAVP